MIRPLRRAHRAIVTSLAAVLPVLVAATLASRRGVPGVTALPSWAASGSGATRPQRGMHAAPLHWERHSTVPIAPDALVYWSRGRPASRSLPPDALLLGSLSRWIDERPLPDAAARTAGWLVLYSVAHGEIVDSARVEVQP